MGILDPSNYQFDLSNFFFWSGLINAIAAFVAGLVVLNRNTYGKKNIAFFLFSLSVAAWAAPFAVCTLALTEQTVLFWLRLQLLGGAFAAIFLLYFVLVILELDRSRNRTLFLLLILLLEVFSIAIFSPLIIEDLIPSGVHFAYLPVPGSWHLPHMVVWVGTLAYAITLMAWGLMESSGLIRQQRKLIFIGLCIGALSAMSNYLPWYGFPNGAYLNITTSIYVLTVAYAMLRYRLFEISPEAIAADIIDTMADALFIVNDEQRIAVANNRAAQVLGLPLASLQGMKIEAFLLCAPTVIKRLLEGRQRKSLTEYSSDNSILRSAGGLETPISLSVSRAKIGKIDAFVFVCHDITDIRRQITVIGQQGNELTEKKNQLEQTNLELTESREEVLKALEAAEQEKEASELERKRSMTILRSIGDGVFVVDRGGKLLMLNLAAEKMIDRSAEDTINSHYSNHFVFANELDVVPVADFIGEAMSTGQVIRAPRNLTLISTNDHELPVAVSVAPLFDGDEVFGAVAVIHDETKEREINKAKTEFVSIASHQLRTPLSSLKWLLEMLETSDGFQPSEQQLEYLTLIKRSATRMTKLVNDLLNISQIESGQLALHPHVTDIRRICESSVQDMAPLALSKGLTLRMAPCEIGEACVDANQISNALHNILSNAVKYTPEGGIIEVSGERNGQEITVCVSDTGVGIPPGDQEHIFDKFYRGSNVALLDTEGRGLGLYVVKSVVESSGGKVWVESELGRGTKFFFTLPASRPAESGKKS
ncbi:MAG: ATP-binding protein [Patescibacteria group bacterium]